MDQIVLIIHVFLAIGLIGLILIQHGKGADMGAAFGSGASSTVFGAQGSGSFLTRITAVLATSFFVTSLVLAFLAGQNANEHSLLESQSLMEAEAVTEPVKEDVIPADVPSMDESVDVPAVAPENAVPDVPK